MGIASKQYAAFLLALLSGHSLATHFHNISTGDNVIQGLRSSAISSTINASSVAGNAEEGCLVLVYPINAYNWIPNTDLRELPKSEQKSALKDVPTNSAGTQTTTIEWTSGVKVLNGTWTNLMGTTTVTFPTGFSYINPTYQWLTTSGSSSGSHHVIPISSAAPFPTPVTAMPSGANGERMKGLEWSLNVEFEAVNISEIEWLRSVYPQESPLQECHATPTFMMQHLPPHAVQIVPMLSASTTNILRPSNTLATFDTSAMNSVGAHRHKTRPTHDALNGSTRSQSQQSPRESAAETSVAVKPLPASSMESKPKSTTVTQLAQSEEKGARITIGSTTVTADIATRYKIGTKTLSLGGSAVVISRTTYSLACKGTAMIINGDTTKIDAATRKTSVQAVKTANATSSIASSPPTNGLSLETLSSSKVLVNGHTLDFNSTLTLGSGSVVTRVALGTNSVGQTVLLGDSITKAPGTSCVGSCSLIRASFTPTSNNLKPTVSHDNSPSTTGSSSSTRPHAITVVSIVVSIGIHMLFVLL